MRGSDDVFVIAGAPNEAPTRWRYEERDSNGHHVLIFPEGFDKRCPGLRRLSSRAFETAASSNCPVVPIGIRGSREGVTPRKLSTSTPVQFGSAIGDPVMSAGSEFSDRVGCAMRFVTRSHDCAKKSNRERDGSAESPAYS